MTVRGGSGIEMNWREGAFSSLRFHDNVHFATEPCQHPHDAFHGDVAKSPFEHPRKIGLAAAVCAVRASLRRTILSRHGRPTPVRAGRNGPGIWLRMQTSYDAWHAARDVDVSAVKPLRAA
jgi:hypothetical protein